VTIQACWLSQLSISNPIVQCCLAGVSIVLACTNWDALRNKADPEALRTLAHALRWLAHSNAAHLLYVGGLQPGAAGKPSFEAVLLPPLTNQNVPFRATACTLELCRVVWCGQYRSAVKVSN
jgi:hypothetical protein